MLSCCEASTQCVKVKNKQAGKKSKGSAPVLMEGDQYQRCSGGRADGSAGSERGQKTAGSKMGDDGSSYEVAGRSCANVSEWERGCWLGPAPAAVSRAVGVSRAALFLVADQSKASAVSALNLLLQSMLHCLWSDGGGEGVALAEHPAWL